MIYIKNNNIRIRQSFKSTFFNNPWIYSFGQMNKLEAYKILGLKNDPTNYEELKTAYLRLSKKYHPDINQDPSSVNTFKDINEAYTTLKNMIRSFEDGGQSFSLQKSKYNKYDGKISKEEFDIFKKYTDEKMKKQAMDKTSFDEIEKEWHKSEEKIFYEIFGKTYQEAPEVFWDEKNQNLREIYEDEVEKLFKKKFSEKIDSIEKTVKQKIEQVWARKPPKSKDRSSFKESVSKFFKK